LSKAIGSGTSTGMVQIWTAMPSSVSAAMTSAWNAATVLGASGRARAAPVDVRIASTWSMKSNSISKFRSPNGIALVVRPRALT